MREAIGCDAAPGSYNYRVYGVMNILFGCDRIHETDPELQWLISLLDELFVDVQMVWVEAPRRKGFVIDRR